MVDMMINLLLFLLNLYGNTSVAVVASPDLKFAPSTEIRPLRFAPVVVVSQASVQVAGETVGTWAGESRAPDASELAALDAALERVPRGEEEGELLLQVDRRVAWSALGPVLEAAGRSGFANVRFAVSSTTDPLAP
jgi:hypothetical protein